MFSLDPDDYKAISYDYYCKKEVCQQKATFDKLKKQDKTQQK